MGRLTSSIGSRSASLLQGANCAEVSEWLRARVVRRQQEGNFVLYALPDALVIKAVALVCRGVPDDRARLARLATSTEPEPNGAPS